LGLQPAVAIPIALVVAYLIGSTPFSLLIGRWVGGIDLRQHGSRNVGATNVARTLGLRWGLVALALDALKGLAPVLLLSELFLDAEHPSVGHLRVGCGLAAICGHMFPCWLGFRGGKGVATALGVVTVLAPWATLAAFGVFAVTFAASRFVSLSSILAAAGFAIAEFALLRDSAFSAANWSLAVFSLAVPALIIFRHRSNLARLVRGEEPRFQRKRTPGAADSVELQSKN
jgi:glycerol-3-phosphate acyltransferase PlsY